MDQIDDNRIITEDKLIIETNKNELEIERENSINRTSLKLLFKRITQGKEAGHLQLLT